MRILEECTQWANRAELYVRLFRETVCKDILDTGFLLIFWDSCDEKKALIINMMVNNHFQLQGKIPYFAIVSAVGEEGGIPNICNFG